MHKHIKIYHKTLSEGLRNLSVIVSHIKQYQDLVYLKLSGFRFFDIVEMGSVLLYNPAEFNYR